MARHACPDHAGNRGVFAVTPRLSLSWYRPHSRFLHIGHLCGIMMLRHLQSCGHKPFLLVGGATGMIGDPSGKSLERNLLDSDTLYHNQEAIKKQVSKFLDFDGNEPNKAELVNNYDWMKDYKFLDFVRDIGKHITVNYMMWPRRACSSVSMARPATVCRSRSSLISFFRATTSSISISTMACACSSAATTSGVT